MSDVNISFYIFSSVFFCSGNLPLHTVTHQGHYELRVDLEDWDGNTAFAKYRYFRIDAPEKLYRIMVVGYFGNAGTNISITPFLDKMLNYFVWFVIKITAH